MADRRDIIALLTLRRMDDWEFDRVVSWVPLRYRILIILGLIDWEEYLPTWYSQNIMEPERLAKARKEYHCVG